MSSMFLACTMTVEKQQELYNMLIENETKDVELTREFCENLTLIVLKK